MTWAVRASLLAAALVAGLWGIWTVVGSTASRAPLLVGTPVWIGCEPLYVARELGFFPEGRVHMVEYSSATQLRTAFRNGVIDVTSLTLDELVLLRRRGFDVKAILVLDESAGGDAIVARAPIERVEELRGRRIAVENTAFGAYVLARALQRAGMTIDDVQAVHMAVDEQPAAWAAGAIDAAVTIDPQRAELLGEGARQIFDSSEIPGEIIDVLAVRASVLEERGEDIEALLAGWLRAVDAIERRPEDALPIVGARMHLSVDEVRRSLQGIRLPGIEENLRMLSGSPSPVERAARSVQRVMIERGLLDTTVDLTELSDPGPLRRAAGEAAATAAEARARSAEGR